jgi:ribosome maturation factor RimP
VKQELEVIVAEALTGLGYDLVEFRFGGSRRRPVLDVRMEHSDGSKVSVDDCARVSRFLETRIDEAAPALADYVLEVSSPGLERPLRKAEEWRRFSGRSVNVLSDAVGGRGEFELLGLEGAEGSEVAVLKDKRGEATRVPLSAVKEARLVFNWKR